MEANGPKIGRHQQPQQRNFVIMVTFATSGKVARVGEGTRDHSYEWAKGRILLVGTLARLGWPILPRVHPWREEAFFQPTQKPVCSGGLLVGGRRGWSQQLHDHAGITPVDFDPFRPADLAQSALRQDKKLSFSPFATKAGMFWRSAGGRSPRLEPTVAWSRGHHSRRL